MLIGGDFNNKAKELIAGIAAISNGDIQRKISVEEIVEELNLDHTEIKNLLGYLETKELIRVATIGGPFLYGHIYITEKGLHKSKLYKVKK